MPARRPAPRRMARRSRLPPQLQQHVGTPGQPNPVRIAQLLVAATLISIAVGTVYYYNLFVDMEQNVNTAQAQIDRELQRRTDLIQNLLPAVFEYAELERHVFTQVATLRAQRNDDQGATASAEVGGAQLLDQLAHGSLEGLPNAEQLGALFSTGSATGGSFGELLGRIIAVSEQYPDMKSSAPFKILMEKVVDIEDRVAVERGKYNDCVNRYTTLTASFPGHIFARLFGFGNRELFRAEAQARQRPQISWPQRERLQ